jgi:hypothetical protein
MKKGTLNGRKFSLPENWNEVAESFKKQLPELLEQLYVLPESGSTYHNILRILLGYTPKQWAKLMKDFFGKNITEESIAVSTQSLFDLLNEVSWMWNSDLNVAPFKTMLVKNKKWFLFDYSFQNMSFGELSDAYIHAQAFIKQLVEGEERLNMLFATLCRPERDGDYKNDPKWNGDPREDYNSHISQHRAKDFNGLIFSQKVLALVHFMGAVKNFFSYFDLFDDDGSAPPVPEEYPGQSMIKNQHLLSEKGIFGGMDATRSANVHSVFQFLEEHHKDVKDQIARAKANQA